MEVSEFLPQLHSCQLKIAEEIKRVCDKNNIKYYIIAGTLLGAVRHNGFIPWDDDMDIGMLREDYNRFLKACETDLGEDFILQTTYTDPAYGLNFAKILLKGTRLVESVTAKNNCFKGIYVDVFPFDNTPDDQALAKKHDKKIYFLRRLLLAKQNYSVSKKGELLKSAVYFALKTICLFFTHDKLCNALEREITKYNGQNTRKIVNVGGAYGYKKETLERSWFEETVSLQFENDLFSAPSGYKEYLEYFYGDYMTPPPEDKRYNRHDLVELDFGEY